VYPPSVINNTFADCRGPLPLKVTGITSERNASESHSSLLGFAQQALLEEEQGSSWALKLPDKAAAARRAAEL